MSKLHEFIGGLEDFELLAFYKYRYDSFLDASRGKIIAEIAERGLKLDSIDDIISGSKGSDYEIRESICCPRCYSRKFYQADENDLISFDTAGVEISNRFKTCMICLYSQDKKNYARQKRGFFSRFKLLGNSK